MVLYVDIGVYILNITEHHRQVLYGLETQGYNQIQLSAYFLILYRVELVLAYQRGEDLHRFEVLTDFVQHILRFLTCTSNSQIFFPLPKNNALETEWGQPYDAGLQVTVTRPEMGSGYWAYVVFTAVALPNELDQFTSMVFGPAYDSELQNAFEYHQKNKMRQQS